jgi:N-methylhydantoinase B
LRVEEYAFVPDSGGPGRYRGGLALVRQYRFLEREGALQLRTDRQKYQPWGLNGGKPGAPSSNLLVRGGIPENPPSKAYRILHHGDVLRHTMAGAGGHGNPLLRDPALVAEDVADEKVSAEHARREYGVVIDPATGAVDAAATAVLREQSRQHDGLAAS